MINTEHQPTKNYSTYRASAQKYKSYRATTHTQLQPIHSYSTYTATAPSLTGKPSEIFGEKSTADFIHMMLRKNLEQEM